MSRYDTTLIQGSTPTMDLEFPFSIPDSGAAVVVTIVQEERTVLEYAYGTSPTPAVAASGRLTRSEEDGVMVLEMTQADTFHLAPGDIEIQCRIRTDDGADTFAPLLGRVLEAFNKEVL